MTAHPYCLGVAVDASALERLLEDGEVGGYRDAEPWHVAADLLAAAQERGERLYLLMASDSPLRWVRWAEVTEIEVHEYASRRETRLRFARSGDMNPIFEDLDAVVLRAPQHQLEREQREGLRRRRIHVDPSWLHAYAICETPSFLLAGDPADAPQAARTGGTGAADTDAD
ncbi:MAG TPA: hypothetical protein VLA56_20365 [Pseudomonadales bacterium]|nr:hypothetical protein [Pseudomonadales bacterium]